MYVFYIALEAHDHIIVNFKLPWYFLGITFWIFKGPHNFMVMVLGYFIVN